MEFETITDMAYRKEELKGSSTILEQLIWHKMVLIYQDYQKGVIDIVESKKRKEKLKSFFITQRRLDDFYKVLHDETYKNIRESTEMLKNIENSIEEGIDESILTEKLIDYVVKVTGIVPIKTKYKKRYEVK